MNTDRKKCPRCQTKFVKEGSRYCGECERDVLKIIARQYKGLTGHDRKDKQTREEAWKSEFMRRLEEEQ